MADANANIRIDVDTSAALANIKNLQRQISMFHSQMAQGGAKAAAASAQMSQSLINGINATKGFSAQLTTISSSSEAFTTALEKNKLSMGQYFRFAGASTKTFGKLFKTEFNTIEKVARERVKDLQTQYIKLGRNASGSLQAIKVRPLTLDMENFGTQTAMAAQKFQLFNQLVKQGSTNLLNWGKNTQWAGRQLMVGFTVPLTIFGTLAAREFQKLEEQAIKFRRVYGDMFTTEADTEKALKNVRELAEEFTKYGIAVEKTVDLAAKVAQMGNVGDALEAQVIQATRLSVLGGMEQMEALDTTISLTNAFKIEIEDLAEQINFLNAAENQTILAIEDFNTAIPLAGSVVQQLGGDVQDLAVLLTAMREGGINASQAGNALKSSLARLIAPSRNAKETLGGFGIDVMSIVDQNAGNLMGTINTLAVALNDLDPLSRARSIEALFGKFQFARMSTLFQNIVDGGSQANKVLDLTTQSAEELAILADRELGRVEESAATKFSKAMESLKAGLAPIGEAFLKAVLPIVEFASKIIERFNKMGDGAQQFVVILSAIGGVVAPALLMVVGLVANGIANVIKFGQVLGNYFGMASGASKNLGEETNYLSQKQLEQLTIASSLDQVHATMTQTFTAQADAIAKLVLQYDRAIQKQKEFSGYGGAAAGAAAAASRGASGGVVRGYASGVLSVPGPKGAGDVVPAMLSPGEAVIPTKFAEKYRPLIQGIIADNIPGFSRGTDGVAMEEMHVGGALPFSPQVVSSVSQTFLPGFDQLEADLQNLFTILGDLVATKSRDLNQAALRFGKYAGKDFSDPETFRKEWDLNEGEGFIGTGERALGKRHEDQTPEEQAAIRGMDTSIRDKVAEKLPEVTEAEKAVEGWLDRLIEAATTEVIDTMATAGTETEQRIAGAMKARKATPATARVGRLGDQIDPETGMPYGTADNFIQTNVARGKLEKRPGERDVFFPGTNLSAGRPEYGKGQTKIENQRIAQEAVDQGLIHNLPMRGTSLSKGMAAKFVPGGTYESGFREAKPGDPEFKIQPATDVFVSPESAGLPSEQTMADFGVRLGDAYTDGLKTSSRDAKDVASDEAGRASPHPDAFPDGADDAKAYLDGQKSVLGPGSDPYSSGSPLAPPPPPPATDMPGRQGMSGKILDKFEDSAVGQAIGRRLAKASGNALTDSQGNVTYDPNEDLTTWAGQMTEESRQRELQIQQAREAAIQEEEASRKLGMAADEQTQSAQMQEQAAKEAMNAAQAQENAAREDMKNNRRDPGQDGDGGGRQSGRGKLAAGIFTAGSIAMGASMMGGPIGDIAGKVAGPLMAIGGVMPLIGKLPGHIQVLVIALGLLAFGIYKVVDSFKQTARRTLELEKALGRGKEAMDKFAEFSGNVTASEIMERRRASGIDPFQVQPGKSTIGENFFASEAGEQLAQNAKDGILVFGKDATVNKVFMQLGQAVATGALDTASAMSIASELGNQLEDRSFGISIRSKLMDLMDPSGADLLVDPIELQVKLNILGQENLEALISEGPKTMSESYEEGFSQMAENWEAYGLGALFKGDWWDGFLRSDKLTGWFFNQQDNVARMAEIVGAARGQVESLASEMDTIEVEFDKKIEDAINSGDSLSYIEDLRQQKLVALEDSILRRQQAMDTALGERATDAGKFDLAMKESLGQMFSGDQLTQAKKLFSEIGKTIENETKAIELQFLMSTGDIPLSTITEILNDWDERPEFAQKRLELATNFGSGVTQQIDAILATISDPALAEDYIAILDPNNLSESREAMEAVTAAARQAGSAFGNIGDSIIGSFVQGPGADAARERLNNDLARLELIDEKMIDMTQPKESNFIFNTFGEEAFYIAQAVWDQVEPGEEKNALYSILTLLDLETTPEYDEFLQSYMGDKVAGVTISDDFTARAALVSRSLQEGRLASASIVDDFEEAAEGGGGKLSSVLDDIVKKLRDVRMNTILMTEGWVASANKLEELFGKGKSIDIFSGLEQDMRRLGLGEDLISLIAGMDPAEFEKKKDQLFTFDAAGEITGITNILSNLGRAMKAVAMGDFQSEQERTIRTINDQVVAIRKLTAAGLSQAAAYEAVQNAAFAAAVAQERNIGVIRQLVRVTKEAKEMTKAFAAAQAVASKNEEVANRRRAVQFLQQNLKNLTDAQKEMVLGDSNVQALIGANVDPKALRQALADAEAEAKLELQIKKLTFEGQLSIFEEGFSKAMESFAVQERKIEIEFDIKKKPFLDAIEEAEKKIQDIRDRPGGVDDLEADLQRISWQEEEITKAYDKRIEALEQVRKINEQISEAQKGQLDVADALSRGDIAGAARAAQEARSSAAQRAQENSRNLLESQKEAEINKLTANLGMTREQIEERILNLKKEIFNLEENTIEPARFRVTLLDREQESIVESLRVLGKTREEWEAIKNNIDIAKISTDQFTSAMQEALDIVDSIVTYWDNFDPDPKDIVINEKRIVSTEMVDPSLDVTPRETGGGGGGGGGGGEDLSRFSGQAAATTQQGRQTGSVLGSLRPADRGPDRREFEEIERAAAAQRKAEKLEADAAAARQKMENTVYINPFKVSENDGMLAGKGEAFAGEGELQKIAQLEADAKKAREDATAQAAVAEGYTQRREQGDPSAIFNTGAMNLLDAASTLFNEIQNNAQGVVANNIAGYFSDLGVKVPTLLKAIPSFFTELPAGIRESIQTEIGDHFKVLATNIPQNLAPISEVFKKLPEEVLQTFQGKVAPLFERYGLELPQNLENINEWWSTIPENLQSEIMPLISSQLLELGNQAVTDLEGTLTNYWDILPGTVKDTVEGQITPVLKAEAEKMGVSVDELLTMKFIDMPESVRDAIENELGAQWDVMAVKAIQAIAKPESALGSMGNNVDPKIASEIGRLVRAGALEGEEAVGKLQRFIASLPAGADVVAAVKREFPDLWETASEMASDSVGLIAETVEELPQDSAVNAAITGSRNGSFPYLFGQGGQKSGQQFGSKAISEISSSISNYQRTNPTITIKVNYDTSGKPTWPNDGGFISMNAPRRNNGGLMRYAKGGLAKYKMGGIAKYFTGGVVGGFGNYDNVPAVLTPGEFVIRREAVEKYGRNFFADLNSTIYNKRPDLSAPSYRVPSMEAQIKSEDSPKSQVMYNNNYSVSINVKSDSNADQIARTVIDQIKRIDSQRIRGNRF
jgi:TP901 family phage tail tape measure protein